MRRDRDRRNYYPGQQQQQQRLLESDFNDLSISAGTYTPPSNSDDHLYASSPYNPGYRRRSGRIDNNLNAIPLDSSYVPPTTSSSFQSYDDNDDQFHDSPQHYGSMNNPPSSSSLYYSAPSAPSFRRAILSQTPARTIAGSRTAISSNSTYNNNNANTTQAYTGRMSHHPSPAKDLTSMSITAYGCCCFQCVRTKEVGILENCGKFERLVEPGFQCLWWPLYDISGRLSLRIQLLEVACETRTSDSVFCNIAVTVNYRVIVERSYDAYYRLTDPRHQIQTYIFDIIRSSIPKLTLEEVFTTKSKDQIATNVRETLRGALEGFGYEICDALVTDIRPVDSVVQSMNEVNASKRMKLAKAHQAEANKFRVVKDAEAHSEALYLSGVGIAGQRKALAQQFQASVLETTSNDKSKSANTASSKEIMDLLLVTQYLDMISTISKEGNDESQNNSMIVRCDPGFVMELQELL